MPPKKSDKSDGEVSPPPPTPPLPSRKAEKRACNEELSVVYDDNAGKSNLPEKKKRGRKPKQPVVPVVPTPGRGQVRTRGGIQGGSSTSSVSSRGGKQQGAGGGNPFIDDEAVEDDFDVNSQHEVEEDDEDESDGGSSSSSFKFPDPMKYPSQAKYYRDLDYVINRKLEEGARQAKMVAEAAAQKKFEKLNMKTKKEEFLMKSDPMSEVKAVDYVGAGPSTTKRQPKPFKGILGDGYVLEHCPCPWDDKGEWGIRFRREEGPKRKEFSMFFSYAVFQRMKLAVGDLEKSLQSQNIL